MAGDVEDLIGSDVGPDVLLGRPAGTGSVYHGPLQLHRALQDWLLQLLPPGGAGDVHGW